jgi:hypothetical protein
VVLVLCVRQGRQKMLVGTGASLVVEGMVCVEGVGLQHLIEVLDLGEGRLCVVRPARRPWALVQLGIGVRVRGVYGRVVRLVRRGRVWIARGHCAGLHARPLPTMTRRGRGGGEQLAFGSRRSEQQHGQARQDAAPFPSPPCKSKSLRTHLLRALRSVFCTLYSALCTLHFVLCTLHSALCTSALCAPTRVRMLPAPRMRLVDRCVRRSSSRGTPGVAMYAHALTSLGKAQGRHVVGPRQSVSNASSHATGCEAGRAEAAAVGRCVPPKLHSASWTEPELELERARA